MSELPEAIRTFLAQPLPGDGEQVVLATTAAAVVDGAVLLPAPGSTGRYARVLVAVADRADLRAVVLPHGVRATAVAVWIASQPSSPGLVPRPEWPALKAFRAQPVAGGYLVVARFEQPVRAANVVRELGRQSVWAGPVPAGGLVVDDGSGPVVAVEDRDVPPDVVLGPGAATYGEHHVTGRAPAALGELEGLLTVFPLDERVLNPIGFQAVVDGPAVTLASLTSGRLENQVPTEALVRSLREAAGVRGDRLERIQAGILVAGLAMAGVPVSVSSVAGDVALLLGPAVVDALTAAVDLDDVVAREEHSVVLRRAALRTFSTGAWHRQVADRVGVRVAAEPSVSVVLATKRPEMLGFALRQVAKQLTGQLGADLQLVLAPHGFAPDPGEVRDLAGPDLADRVVLRPQEESVLFGDVLAGAAAAAGATWC